jgi:tRNA 2-thiouridine synthesizing protein A
MQTVDLRGVACPTNFVKAKLALEMADAGDVICFFLDAGEPVANVSASIQGEGHRLLAREERQGYFVLTVEKVGD